MFIPRPIWKHNNYWFILVKVVCVWQILVKPHWCWLNPNVYSYVQLKSPCSHHFRWYLLVSIHSFLRFWSSPPAIPRFRALRIPTRRTTEALHGAPLWRNLLQRRCCRAIQGTAAEKKQRFQGEKPLPHPVSQENGAFSLVFSDGFAEPFQEPIGTMMKNERLRGLQNSPSRGCPIKDGWNIFQQMYMEVSWNRGTPSHHPFIVGFSMK